MAGLIGSLAPRTGGFFGGLPDEGFRPRAVGDTMVVQGPDGPITYRLSGDQWVIDSAAQPAQPEQAPVQQVGWKGDLASGLLQWPRKMGLPMGAAEREARATAGGFDRRTFYHGTERLGEEGTGLTEMPVTDLGLHLGIDPNQANKRLEGIAGGTSANPASIHPRGMYDEGANILPLRARLGKSLDMPDMGVWKDSERVANQLELQGFDVGGILDEASELKPQFPDVAEYDQPDWVHSDDNQRLLGELNAFLRGEGYDSIRYKNEVESEAGALTSAAHAKVTALQSEIRAIETAARDRMIAKSPVPDEATVAADPGAIQRWLDQQGAPLELTRQEEFRIMELTDEAMALRRDPANLADPHSYIILDPSRVRSTAAAFDPAQAESSNLLYSAIPAAAAGGALTAGLMGSPGEARAESDNLLYSPKPVSAGRLLGRPPPDLGDDRTAAMEGYLGGPEQPQGEPPMAPRLPAGQLRSDVVPPVSGFDARPQQSLTAGPPEPLAEQVLTGVGFSPEEARKTALAASFVPGIGGAVGGSEVVDAARTGDVPGALIGAATMAAPFVVKPIARAVKAIRGGAAAATDLAGAARRVRRGTGARTAFEHRAGSVPETSILHPKRWPIAVDTKAGRYVGAPPGIDTPAKVERLAKKLADMAMTKEGVAGRDFYDEFQGVMRGQTTDPGRARRSAAMTAVTSTDLGVGKNVEASNIIGNQLTLGVPVRAGRYPNRTRGFVKRLLRSGSDVPETPKFARFATHLTPGEMQEAGAPQGAVFDVHMMRAFGYPSNISASGASDANVAFMDAVFERSLEILNKHPGQIKRFGPSPWNTKTGQAAVWARQRHESGLKPYPSAEVLNEQSMIYAPVSAIPGESAAPQLEALRRAPLKDKARYVRAMTNPEQGGVSTQEVANLVGNAPEGYPGVGPWRDMVEPNEVMRIGGGTVGGLAKGKQRLESASFNIAKVATDWWQLGLGQEGAGLLFPKVLGKERRFAKLSNLGQIHSDILRGGNIRGHKHIFHQLRELLGPDWSNKAFPMELPQARGGGFVLKKLPGASQEEFTHAVETLSRRFADESGVGPTWMSDVASHNRGDYTFVDWQKMRGPGSFPRLLDRTLAHPNLVRIFNDYWPTTMGRLHTIHLDQVKPYGITSETTLDRVRMTVRDGGLEGLVAAIKKGTLPAGAGMLVLALSPEVLHQARETTVGQGGT